ncbi:hypothetical protein TrST_g8548 [Triparma strigata]|uniref:EF-hand domain-containing protein n=1 Tax=Triparma strigata TaxID=1606541 RepID=A0A9W7AUS9_9STRA|nr:hypothetical protein TrST_g8548 [Triparma strigata]
MSSAPGSPVPASGSPSPTQRRRAVVQVPLADPDAASILSSQSEINLLAALQDDGSKPAGGGKRGGRRMTAAQKRQAKSDAIKRELMELKTEIKQRGKMTIDERAEVIKSTVEKGIEKEHHIPFEPPPVNVKFPELNTSDATFPAYLNTVQYHPTSPAAPYYLYPNHSHAYGNPSPTLDLSHWHLDDINLRDIVENNEEYTTLSIENTIHFYDNRLKMFASSSSKLTSLFLPSLPKISPYGIKSFFETSQCQLMHLDLSGNHQLDDSSLLIPVKFCSATLTTVKVHHCTPLTDMSVGTLASCPNLVTLEASHLPHITDLSVSAIMRKCQGLKHLNISHNKGIVGTCFVGKSGGGLTTANVHSLEHLDISFCKHLVEGTLYFIGAGLIDLETLIINHYTALRPNEVESLAASAAQHLRHLDLSAWDISEKHWEPTNDDEDKKDLEPDDGGGIHPENLVVMSHTLTCLLTLNLKCSKPDSTLTASSIAALFRIETLSDVNLGYNTHVSDAAFNIPSPNVALKHLRIHGCHNVTNQTLKIIGTNFPSLETLDAPDTEMLHTEKLLRPTEIWKLFNNLAYVDFSSSYKIDDDFVLPLVVNNPALETLILGKLDETEMGIVHPSAFTTKTFVHVAQHCKQLKSLSLLHSLNFGNFHSSGIHHPPPGSLPNLQNLNLSGHKHLTTQSLIHMCHTGPQLLSLKVSMCPQVQHSSKISNVLAQSYCYIAVSPPPFSGFEATNDMSSLYYRDAYFARIQLERESVALIMKNYKCWKRNVLWRWWSSAKKIKRAFRAYKFKASCREYVKFTTKLKKKRAKTRARRQEIFMRMFLKIKKSAIDIQRIYRGHDARCVVNLILDEIDASTAIQAAWRGVRCRMEDHIWIKRKKAELSRLEDLIESGVFLPKPSDPFEIDPRIRKDMPILREKVQEEMEKEPPITFNKDPQPRRFDVEPYVELPFDRKLPIYGGIENDAYSMDLEGKKGVHVFGGSLWPPGNLIKAENEMADFFDPTKTHYQNYCAMLESKNDPNYDPYNPMPDHIPHPKCTLCSKRYMSLTCTQCCTSYCVQCSNHVHSKPAKKHHTVVQYHHQYQKPQRDEGIIPHINSAKLASKKMLALTDMAQNDAELKKIEEAKELEREMEAEEEEERLRAKEAAATEQRLHDAANVLQGFAVHCVHRGKMSKYMEALSKAVVTHDLEEQIQTTEIVKIQKIFRGFSVRQYFKSWKCDVTAFPALPGGKEIAAKRVDVDFANRREYERSEQIETVDELKEELQEMTDVESDWCHKEMEKYEGLLDVYKKKAKVLESEEAVLRAETAKLQVRSMAYHKKSMEMKMHGARKTHNTNLIDSIRTSLRWLLGHLRQTVRRNVQSKVQSGWVAKHLRWIDSETKILKRLLKFVKARNEVVKDDIDTHYYKEWLVQAEEKIVKRLVTYDTEQESILERTLFRLGEEKEHGKGDRDNVIEILRILYWHRQFDAERVGSELVRMTCQPQSDESLMHLERSAKCKAKQQRLVEEVLPGLIQSLGHSNGEEDALLAQVVVFKKDEKGLSRHNIKEIQAVLKDPPKARRVFSEEKWMDMFRSQPWLTRQNAEEGRLDDIRKQTRKNLMKRKAILEKQRKEVELEKEGVAEQEKKILALYEQADDPKLDSELEKRNLRTEAENIRQEIDADAQNKLRREEKLKEEEDKLQAEIDALDKDQKEAETRLAKQKDAIEAFKNSELKEDEIIIEQIEKEKEQIEKEEEMMRKKEEIQGEEATAGRTSGGPEFLQAKAALAKRRQELEEREERFKEAMERREVYYANATKEAEEELRQRKLKDLQLDIRERKLAVLKAQKELEEQLAEEAKAEKEAEEAREKANWQAKQADEDIQNLGVAGMGADGRKKKGIATTMKQFLRKKAGTRDDPEELQMVSTIKKRMKVKGGQVEAIRHIKFTVGNHETDDFTAKQSKLQSEGMPFFRRIGREIGLHDQIVIWVEKTVDQEEFLTDLELAHTDPENPNYVNLLEEGWERSGHPKMRGESPNDPFFCVWFYKGGENSENLPIGDLNLSYTLGEEEELTREGYEMIDISFVEFGFGDMNLWIRRVERSSVPTFANSAHVAKELHECRKMLSKNPDDTNLQDMEEKLLRKLHAAQVHEDESRENQDNPIKYTMEFLALNPAELEQLITYFSYIDLDRDGFILMEEFCEWLNLPMSDYVSHIFNLTGALDDHKRLDFGEFIKAIATFAMLQGEEVLKLLFAMFDPDGEGFITNEQLLEILSVLNPYARGRTTRTLKEFDLPKIDKVTYTMVKNLHIGYPNMFHPAFHFQDIVRKKIFGLPWWERKLRKYMATKSKLRSAQMTSQQVDKAKEVREERRARKAERKVKRIEMARADKSQFVRALYIAKNVADALMPDIDIGNGKSMNVFTNLEEEEMEKKRKEEEANF